MVRPVSEEFEAELRRRFARAREPLRDERFTAALVEAIARARRARIGRLVLIGALILIVASLNVSTLLTTTARLVQAVGEYSSAASELILTPFGWALSMIIGGWILARARWRSRRS